MEIVVKKGGVGYQAELVEGGKTIFTTRWHPRPGCATREAMIHMQILLGLPNKTVRLTVSEWT